MTQIEYEASLHRLRIAGGCGDDECAAIADAIEAFSSQDGPLTVDLTAVTDISVDAARAVTDACSSAQRSGCRVTVLRYHQSDVDVALVQAGLEIRRTGT